MAHPDFLGSHRSQRTGRDRDIGIPEGSRQAHVGLRADFCAEPVEVVPGVWSTGEIPRIAGDQGPGELFVDSDGTQPDRVPDDMALILRHRAGIVVLLGCAHAGVVDTLTWAEQLFPGEPLLGLLGGMHLEHAAPERISEMIERLRAVQPRFVSPGHCTGERAKHALRDALGDGYLPMQVGLELRIDHTGGLSHARLPA